ncbi:unnamed protein product [Urochloa humidicola]
MSPPPPPQSFLAATVADPAATRPPSIGTQRDAAPTPDPGGCRYWEFDDDDDDERGKVGSPTLIQFVDSLKSSSVSVLANKLQLKISVGLLFGFGGSKDLRACHRRRPVVLVSPSPLDHKTATQPSIALRFRPREPPQQRPPRRNILMSYGVPVVTSDVGDKELLLGRRPRPLIPSTPPHPPWGRCYGA